MLRYLTAGESHGRALVVDRRGAARRAAGRRWTTSRPSWPGAGSATAAGPRMRFEQDEVTIVGGVRHGRTLGSPVAIEIANTEWSGPTSGTRRWRSSPARTEAPLTQPRPGHADLAGMQKYGFDDARDVLERASARETAARVAAGALAKLLLGHLGVAVLSHVIQMGSVALQGRPAALARRPRAHRRVAGPLLRRRRGRGDGRRGQGRVQGRRHPGRRRRGPGQRRAGRASAATCTGTGASTACWPRPS